MPSPKDSRDLVPESERWTLRVTENPEINERRYRCTACDTEFIVPLDDSALQPERECDGCHRILRTELCQSTPELLGERDKTTLLDAALRLERLAKEQPVGLTQRDMRREAAAVRQAVHVASPQPVSESPGDSGVGLNKLERWMVDYEGEEGGPVETKLSWITGPDGDPTTKRPEVGDYLVRLRDVQALLSTQPVPGNSGGVEEGHRKRILRELTEMQESYERSRDHWKKKERQDLADQSTAMALGVREARAHVDLAFDAASTQPPSPQAEVQDCGDVAERLAKVLAERDGWDWEKDGTSLTRQMMLDQARSILKAIQPDRSPFVAPEQVDTGEPFEDGGEDAEQAAEDTRNGTGKQPPAEPQGDVVEILARFEFDRLEMGDLRIVGGPLKWEQAGESERGELLDRAREILAAITPLLALEVKERLREKALSNEAVEAFGTGYWRAVSEKQQLQRQQRHGEAKDIALFRRGLEAWLDYLDTPAPSEEER